jgi:ABC-2 type transport system permease protein
MANLSDMLWIEIRKAVRSGMPVGTALGSMFMSFGIAFLIFVARNPEISKQLGLISAKADLMAYAATDWASFLGLFALILASGGILLFGLVVTWVFGREFNDGTMKDLLAVPVQRLSIVLAKFVLVAVWSAILAIIILLFGLVTGAMLKLPGGSLSVILQGSALVLTTASLVIAVVTPFAFFASVGRGYLLPIGAAILALMMANIVALVGWGEYFPWGVPGIYAMENSTLPQLSYWIVFFTSLVGILATYLWWKLADQTR